MRNLFACDDLLNYVISFKQIHLTEKFSKEIIKLDRMQKNVNIYSASVDGGNSVVVVVVVLFLWWW